MINLSHVDSKGNAKMVDISLKTASDRQAVAVGQISMQKETYKLIKQKKHKKGDVISVSKIAAIFAAKKTHELIPLCHPLSLEAIDVDFKFLDNESSIKIYASCKNNGKTGIEMEALTAVSIGALTIYDMCKAVDKEMRIHSIFLTHKSGGKSGTYNKND